MVRTDSGVSPNNMTAEPETKESRKNVGLSLPKLSRDFNDEYYKTSGSAQVLRDSTIVTT